MATDELRLRIRGNPATGRFQVRINGVWEDCAVREYGIPDVAAQTEEDTTEEALPEDPTLGLRLPEDPTLGLRDWYGVGVSPAARRAYEAAVRRRTRVLNPWALFGLVLVVLSSASVIWFAVQVWGWVR